MRTADVMWSILMALQTFFLLMNLSQKKWQKCMVNAVLLAALVFTASAHASDDFAYRVKCEHAETTSHGTAAAISSHQLVTAAHVIKDAEEIFIDHEIGWLRCRVVKVDESNDLAVIECLPVTLKFVPLDTTAAKAGEAVTVCASVAGLKIRSLDGVIRKLFDAHRWLCDIKGFGQGGSGGPVIHDSKLIGVATALQGDTRGNAIANTCVFVCADCVQRMLAPETFEGEKLPAPKTKAEIVLPPTVKENLTVRPVVKESLTTESGENHEATTSENNPVHIRGIEHGAEILSISPSQSCASPHCKAQADRCTEGGVRIRSPLRHWDSDIDGHGQGGWVYEN